MKSTIDQECEVRMSFATNISALSKSDLATSITFTPICALYKLEEGGIMGSKKHNSIPQKE